MKNNSLTIKQKIKQLREIFTTIDNIVVENKSMDKSIEKFMLAVNYLTPGQKNFALNTIKDLIKYRKLLLYASGINEDKIPGLYENWQMYGVYLVLQNKEHMMFPSLKELDKEEIKRKLKAVKTDIAIRESFPEWFVNKLKKQYKDYENCLIALNQNPTVYLRVNAIKTDIDQLQDSLFNESVESKKSLVTGNCLEVQSTFNLFKTQAFKDGWFEIQDLSSQLAAGALNPKPSQIILDVCCGNGGKSLYFSSAMKNTGKIYSLDIFQHKIGELKKRAARSGASNIEPIVFDFKTDKVPSMIKNHDSIFIDAPCSGTGVWHRNPDGKWKMNEQKLTTLVEEQKAILDFYSSLCNQGKKLIYVVCSILKEEGEMQIKSFLERNKLFDLIKEQTILPQYHNSDGFYIAELRKK